ncbi:MAG: MarR family transcriptional regulator, partial [Bacteroidales bacterium]|nr:MarR family transcriptional regulator [Bacteroidales bacterium]
KQGLVSRKKGREDGRQVIVSLTEEGRALERRAADIPAQIGARMVCARLTPDAVPELFATLDEMILALQQ